MLVVDNYDSFTHNLVHGLAVLGARCEVRMNDQITPEDVIALQPDAILISPGPGRPETAGTSVELVRRFAKTLPIWGVCLGHQALAMAFGAAVERAPSPFHGKTSLVEHAETSLFSGVASPFTAMRYHSLVVAEQSLPPELEVVARTSSGEIMALRHRDLPLWGVQFHPESVLTPDGPTLMRNWLDSL